MYAGTIQGSTVDNLFYWLFRNSTRDTATPLVIWINGGPGATSMFGLFAENGPLHVTRNGTSNNDFVIGWNPQGSWFDLADVLYID